MLGLVLLGRLGLFLWQRRSTNAPQPPAPVPPDKAQFSKPNPEDMAKQVESLPPFQQEAGWSAYKGLEVCWQAVLRGIGEDEPANQADPTAKKKWVVDLKHCDPSVPYSSATICCPGVDFDEYPQFKSLHNNELLIVRGRVDTARYSWVLIYPSSFEFCGKRVEQLRA